MLTIKEISVSSREDATRAALYPVNDHELGFASKAQAVASYYGGSSPGALPHDRLDDKTLRELGLKRGVEITPEQRAEMLLGRSADGQRQLAKAKDRKVSGYDFTFSADKSVSILWSMADEAQRAKIELVLRAANARAMEIVNREIGKVRRGAQGKAGHDKVQLIYSSHTHFTARPTEAKETPGAVDTTASGFRFDPQLHVHNQIMSMARAPDGKWLTIDTKLVHGLIHYTGSIFQAEIARGLRELGLEISEENGAATVVGFSPEIRRHFSARTVTAEENARDFAHRNGEDFDALPPERKAELVKAGSAATRLSKGKEEDPDSHFEAWRREAAEFGYDEEAARDFWRPRGPADIISKTGMIEIAAQTAGGKLAAFLTREAIVDGRKFRDICAHAMVAFSELRETDIEAVMKRTAEMPVTVHGVATPIRMFRNTDGEIKFTTQSQLDGEKRLFEICRKSRADHNLDFEKIEQRFDPERPPNEGQLKAIRMIASGGDITIVEGAAGVGKTTLLQAPVVAYREAGYTVVGLSIANRTAKALTEAGIDDERCLSIEAFVQGLENGRITLSKNTLVVIDEFSQVDIRRGAAVFDAVSQAGGKLIALGDEFQSAAIDAGSAMRMSKAAIERSVVEVTATVRQQGEAAEIASAFRKGGKGVAEAVEKKIKNGDFLYVPGGREATISAIVGKWVELGGLNGKCTISAPTNHDVLSISRGMRSKLREVGRLGDDVAKLQVVDTAGNQTSLDIAIGDKLMLLKKAQGVVEGSNLTRDVGYNGSLVELVDLDRDGKRIVVKTQTGKVFRVPLANLRDKETGRLMLGYGYALTIDKAQGITSDNHINALLAGTDAIDAKKFYVNESRHRKRCVTMIDRDAEIENIKRKLAIGVKLPPVPEQALVEYSIKNIEKCALKMNATDFVDAGGVKALEAAAFARSLAVVSKMPDEQKRVAKNNAARAARARSRRIATSGVFDKLGEVLGRVRATVKEVSRAVVEAAKTWRDRRIDRPEHTPARVDPIGIDI